MSLFDQASSLQVMLWRSFHIFWIPIPYSYILELSPKLWFVFLFVYEWEFHLHIANLIHIFFYGLCFLCLFIYNFSLYLVYILPDIFISNLEFCVCLQSIYSVFLCVAWSRESNFNFLKMEIQLSQIIWWIVCHFPPDR